MSHFLAIVLVPAGTSLSNAEAVASKMLDPYHEFECTGRDDEFVQTLDITEELVQEYEHKTTRRLRSPDGKLHEPYDSCFYADPTDEQRAEIGPIAGCGGNGKFSWSSRDWGDGLGYRTKVRFIPDGWEEIEIPTKEVKTFEEFVDDWSGKSVVHSESEIDLSGDHKYGYMLCESGKPPQVFNRTNPNAKWDWWVVGGRWSGCFTPSYNIYADPRNYERCFICRGTGSRIDTTYGPDQEWARTPLEDCPFPAIGSGCNGCHGTGKRLKHAPDFAPGGNIVPVAELPDDLAQPFAIVTPDGKWHEKGEMGWFGMARNKKSDDDWSAFLNSIRSEHAECIAVAVDCHI